MAQLLFGDLHRVARLHQVHAELWANLDHHLVKTFEASDALETEAARQEEEGADPAEVVAEAKKTQGDEEGEFGEEEVEEKEERTVKVKEAGRRRGGGKKRAATLGLLFNKRSDQKGVWKKYADGVEGILAAHAKKWPDDFPWERADVERVGRQLRWEEDEMDVEEAESEAETTAEGDTGRKTKQEVKRKRAAKAREREMEQRSQYGKALRANVPLCTKTLLRIVDERLAKIPNAIIEVSSMMSVVGVREVARSALECNAETGGGGVCGRTGPARQAKRH